MIGYKKKVLVSSLLCILLLCSLVIGFKTYKTYYYELENSNGDLFESDVIECVVDTNNSYCNETRYLNLPQDYQAFGDNSIKITCTSTEGEWNAQDSGYFETTLNVRGLATNVTDGATEPEYFWVVSDATPNKLYFNGTDEIEFVGFEGNLDLEDIDYDKNSGTFWAIGEYEDKEVVVELDLTQTSASIIISHNFSSGIIRRYGIAVYGQYLYVRDESNNIKKIDKTTGDISNVFVCNECPTGDLVGIETVDGNYFWLAYINPAIIFRVNATGVIQDNIITELDDGLRGIHFNFIKESGFDESQLGIMWLSNFNTKNIEYWKKGGYPKNVSLKIGDEIYNLPKLNDSSCRVSDYLVIMNSSAINDWVNNENTTVPFSFYSGSTGKIEYSDLNVYADDENFNVKIIYPENGTLPFDNAANISFYIEEAGPSPTSCDLRDATESIYTFSGPIANNQKYHFIAVEANSLYDAIPEGENELFIRCEGLLKRDSDIFNLDIDKKAPIIIFDDSVTFEDNAEINSEYGGIPVGVELNESFEFNIKYILYNMSNGDVVKYRLFNEGDGGIPLPRDYLFENVTTGMYRYEVITDDVLGKRSTTGNRTIKIDSDMPYQDYTDPLNDSIVDVNFQQISIDFKERDSGGSLNDTWIIVQRPDGINETILNTSGLSDVTPVSEYEGSVAYTAEVGGEHVVFISGRDWAGNVGVDNYTFNTRTTASVIHDAKPDQVLYLESETWGTNFTINTTFENTGLAGAYDASVYLEVPDENWTAVPGLSYDCGDLFTECNVDFYVTVPKYAYGAFTVKVHFNYTHPSEINVSESNYPGDYVNINIDPNRETQIIEDKINNSIFHGRDYALIDSFYINVTGNAQASGFAFDYSGGNLNQSWIVLSKQYVEPLQPQQTGRVDVKVSIPIGTPTGWYNTTLNMYSNNHFRDTLNISVFVPVDYNYTIEPFAFSHQTMATDTEGIFGYVTVYNLGNREHNLTFQAKWNKGDFIDSQTMEINPQFVEIEGQDNFSFEISYDFTGVGGGNYFSDIEINELVSGVKSNSYINVTLLDTPPDFNSFDVAPYYQSDEFIELQLNITDNKNPRPDANATLKKPDGSTTPISIINRNDIGQDDRYDITITPQDITNPGVYTLIVWADDGYVDAVNQSRIFESVNETYFKIWSDYLNFTLSSITYYNSEQIGFNVSTTNYGKIDASEVFITVDKPTDFVIEVPTNQPYEASFPPLSSYFRSDYFRIRVPERTAPGDYMISPKVSWQNPGDLGASNTSSIMISVDSNKIMSILNVSINKTIYPTTSDVVPIMLSSRGNALLENVTLICQEGTACDDFSVAYSDNNFDMLAGENKLVNISFSVPYLYDAGAYPTLINVTGEDEDVYSFNLIVPDDDSWSLIPENISVSAGADSYGNAGIITIESLGNMLLDFEFLSTDNGSVWSAVEQVYVLKNSTTDVDVMFHAPNSVGNHSFELTVFNNDYTVSERIVNVTIEVINFSVVPVEPTEIDPLHLVLIGDTLQIEAEAFYENDTLTSGVDWSIEIDDIVCPVTTQAYIGSSWSINCTAPSLDDGLYYDLDIIGVYVEYNAEYTATELDAIHYRDITAPNITSNHETDVENGSTVSLTIDTYDNIYVNDSWVDVTYPNGSMFTYNMTQSDTQFSLDIPGLAIGDYDVVYHINDTCGNPATIEDMFEVYEVTDFIGDILDSEGQPTPTEFYFYRPDMPDVLFHNFSVDSPSGYSLVSGEIHDRNYDINISVDGSMITLYNVTIDETTHDPIDIDYIVGEEILMPLHKPLLGIGVVSDFDVHGAPKSVVEGNTTVTRIVNGTLSITYRGTVYSDKNSIELFKCFNWSYLDRNCQSDWIKLNSTKDVVNSRVTANIDSFSAYLAAESRCGNGLCESSSYFETEDNCPDDCKAAGDGTTITYSSSGGGGGGISRSAMEILLQKYVPNTTNLSSVPQLNLSEEIRQALESPTMIQGVKVATTSIYRELFPGENLTTGIILRNVDSKNAVRISARAIGSIEKLITFAQPIVTLKPLQEMNFAISIVTPQFLSAGSYEGGIILESGDRSLQIPVSIRIQEKTEKLLDMKIQPIVNSIAPGEDLKIQIDVYNLGKTPRVDVNLTYELVDAVTDNVIAMKQESIAVETTLSHIRTLSVPIDAKLGNYLIRGTANYLTFNKTSFASSLAYVKVAKAWYLYELFGVIPVWIIFSILLFVGLNAGMFLGWQKYQAGQKKYKIDLDLKELPQPGERTAYIGHIAETHLRTFFEVDKLTTHAIVAGSTGGGKSVAAQVLVEEALKNNVAVIVFDPTAQWTGFLKPCKERRMLKYYPKFQMKTSQAQGFNGNIRQIENPRQLIDIKKFMNPGEINIFSTNKLKFEDVDTFVANTVRQVFEANLDESPTLRLLLVYDEVHRLLPKFGGSGEGFLQIERACREFRKWGLGLVLISQVLTDFVGSIKANINTEVQVRTRDEGDLDRLKTKYGEDSMKSIVKASVGTAMIQNSAYNKGRPYFVEFRALLHSITRLSDDELSKYQKSNDKIDDFDYQLEQLEKEKIDVFDLRLELKLSLDKLKVGKFNMVNIYLEGIAPRLKKHWDKIGKEPKKREIALASEKDIKAAIRQAQLARKEFEKKQKKESAAEENASADDSAEAPAEEVVVAAEEKPKKGKKGKGKKVEPVVEAPAEPEVKVKPEAKHKPVKAAKPAPQSPVEIFKDRYKSLQEMMSAKRKSGKDIPLIEIEAESIPSDIKMFEAMGNAKNKKKLEKKFSNLEKKLK